jgi:hypothetical protein
MVGDCVVLFLDCRASIVVIEGCIKERLYRVGVRSMQVKVQVSRGSQGRGVGLRRLACDCHARLYKPCFRPSTSFDMRQPMRMRL